MNKIKFKSKFEALASLLIFVLLILFVTNINLNQKTKTLSPIIAGEQIYEEDTIYVKFTQLSNVYNEQSAKNKINQVLNENQVNSVKKVLPNKNGRDNIYQVFLKPRSNLDQISSRLSQDSSIEYVSKEVVTEPAAVIPNDYYFPWEWYHNNTGNEFWDNISGTNKSYYPGALAGADIDTPEAWEINTGSPNIIIAYGDVRFELDHPDMQGQFWINENETTNNFIDDDGNGYADDYYGYNTALNRGNHVDLDCTGESDCHGAGVSGWVAKFNNSIGIAGVCPGCRAMAISASGGVSGIPYAIDNGANIFSMSWAGSPINTSYSENLINLAHDNGLVVFSAAGNDCVGNQWGCGLNSSIYPQAYDHVISVAGIDVTGSKYWTSSYYSAVDLAAPMAHLDTLNNLSDIAGNSHGYTTFWNKYGWGSGTSFAGPMAAAVGGLVLSENPSLTPDEVESILQTSAKPIPSGSTTYFLGNGVLNAYGATKLAQQSLAYGSYPVSLIDWRFKQNNNLLSIYGRAYSPDFDHYRIEIGNGNYPTSWTGYDFYQQATNNELLGQFPITVSTPNATKAVRVIVYDTNGQNATDIVAYLVTQTTADTTPPVISNEQAALITSNKSTISWNTNENAIGKVGYGTSPGVYTNNISEIFYNKTHAIELTSLTANTTYYVNILSTDASGNTANKQLSFQTLGQADSIPPTISNVQSFPSTIIVLKDNVQISAFVQDNNEVGQVLVEINNIANYTMIETGQQVQINGTGLGPIVAGNFSTTISSLALSPGTFNYRIIAFDSSGNVNTSNYYSFTILSTCILDSVYWEPGSSQISGKELFPPTVNENSTVKIVLRANYCNQTDTFSVQLKEDDMFLGLEDFDTADSTQISFNNIQITSNQTEVNVTIPWEEDYDSLNKNPEYIMRATLNNGIFANNYADSTNYLKVSGDKKSPNILSIKEATSVFNNTIAKTINATFNEYVYSNLIYGDSPTNLNNSYGVTSSVVSEQQFVLFFPTSSPQQNYFYKITGYDEDNNPVESQINQFTIPSIIDNINPVINSVTLSSNPLLINDILKIDVNTTDNSGISSVVLSVDSTNNYTLNYLSGFYSTNYTKTDSPGVHNYKVVVIDTSGNRAQYSNTFNIVSSLDVTPPSITNVISSPNPVFENNPITISADVNDNFNVSQVLLEIDNSINISMTLVSGITYQTISAPTSSLGLHTYKIIAFDSSNNKAELSGFNYNVTIVPDTTPPVISNIQYSVTENSSLISWNTNEIATSEIYYNSSTPIQIGVFTPSSYNYSLVLNHALYLNNLSSSTTYYYIIFSADDIGNIANSSEQSFTTLSAPDITPPIINGVSSNNINENSAVINWNTNENANSLVRYGTAPGSYTNSVSSLNNYITLHSITLTGLTSNTTYYYIVNSSDVSGNSAISSESSFTTSVTSTPPDNGGDNGGSGGGSGGAGGGSGGAGTSTQENTNTNTINEENQNEIDLTNVVSIDKTLDLTSYSLMLVNGIQHTLTLTQADSNSATLSLDGTEIILQPNTSSEIYLDGYRLIIYYRELVGNSLLVTFEKDTLVEAQFSFISILVILLILIAGSLLGLSFYLKNRNKYKNL